MYFHSWVEGEGVVTPGMMFLLSGKNKKASFLGDHKAGDRIS